MTKQGIIAVSLLAIATALGCGSSAGTDSCPVNAPSSKFVQIGFWKTTDCSGTPISTNNFPVDPAAPCYCWPGHSGENSANSFKCDKAASSFTYSQYQNLTCGTVATVKTSYTTKCQQDVPPTLYAKIIDFTACM